MIKFCIICVVIIGFLFCKEYNFVVLIIVFEQVESIQEVFEVGVMICYVYVCNDD